MGAVQHGTAQPVGVGVAELELGQLLCVGFEQPRMIDDRDQDERLPWRAVRNRTTELAAKRWLRGPTACGSSGRCCERARPSYWPKGCVDRMAAPVRPRYPQNRRRRGSTGPNKQVIRAANSR
jgi:hypothetical protein